MIFPSGNQARESVVRREVRQPPLSAPVGVHDVHLLVPVRASAEGDLAPIGRPGRTELASRGACQSPLAAAVRIDDVDLALAVAGGAVEGDLPPIGRPGRSSDARAGQQPLPAPIGVHDVEQEGAASATAGVALVADEGELGTCRSGGKARPRRERRRSGVCDAAPPSGG